MPIAPLNFCCDPYHPETKQLKKKYEETRASISKIYGAQPFFEAIVEKLLDDR